MSRWADIFETEISTRKPHAKTAKTAKRSDLGGFGSFGSFGMGQTDDGSGSDRVHVLTPTSPPEPDNQSEWDSETRQLIDWFLSTTTPTEPFKLCRGVTILDPVRWWRSIEGDIGCGHNGPRARYGAVQGDLRRLYDLLVGVGRR